MDTVREKFLDREKKGMDNPSMKCHYISMINFRGLVYLTYEYRTQDYKCDDGL